MKKSSKMKEYIKPAIRCMIIESMQIMDASVHISDEDATEEACAKEYHLSSKSLWDEEDDWN